MAKIELRFRRPGIPAGVHLRAAGLVLGVAMAAATVVPSKAQGETGEDRPLHVNQFDLLDLVKSGAPKKAFVDAFELGDELFENKFSAEDGVGANVGEGQRFTRVPRADLKGEGEWYNHMPPRTTGPNGRACDECHNQPFSDGAGSAALAVHRSPLREESPGAFIRRDAPHLFGLGALQRLAEEMTRDLLVERLLAGVEACKLGQPVSRPLEAKGVSFGEIVAVPSLEKSCQVAFDTAKVTGVEPDLVVRPLQWKGNFVSVRDFTRDAAHNELGMQPVETTGDGVDGDFDGVVDELTVGDLTALVLYTAAQPRPTTRRELASLGVIEPLTAEEQRAIAAGRKSFEKAGCASCHRPELKIEDPVFSEPSQHLAYRDEVFPAGQDPLALGVDPRHPVSFDLTADQPDNVIKDEAGEVTFHLGAFRRDEAGRAVVELFGDLKHHDMGPELAENVDETGIGASVFLTAELWGVGSTAPYLHDGRATTLAEAISFHGGEAAESRDAFKALSLLEQKNLIAFLNDLVLFKFEEEEEEEDAES